jgi:hypothetical protein
METLASLRASNTIYSISSSSGFGIRLGGSLGLCGRFCARSQLCPGGHFEDGLELSREVLQHHLPVRSRGVLVWAGGAVPAIACTSTGAFARLCASPGGACPGVVTGWLSGSLASRRKIELQVLALQTQVVPVRHFERLRRAAAARRRSCRRSSWRKAREARQLQEPPTEPPAQLSVHKPEKLGADALDGL